MTRRSQEPTNKQTPVIKGVARRPGAAGCTPHRTTGRGPCRTCAPASRRRAPAACSAPPAPQSRVSSAGSRACSAWRYPQPPCPPAPARRRRRGTGPRTAGTGEVVKAEDAAANAAATATATRDANGRDGAEGRGAAAVNAANAHRTPAPPGGGARPPREGREGARRWSGPPGRRRGTPRIRSSTGTAPPQRNKAWRPQTAINRNEGTQRTRTRAMATAAVSASPWKAAERQPRNQDNLVSNAPADFADTALGYRSPTWTCPATTCPQPLHKGEAGETRTRRSRDRYGRDRQRGERGNAPSSAVTHRTHRRQRHDDGLRVARPACTCRSRGTGQQPPQLLCTCCSRSAAAPVAEPAPEAPAPVPALPQHLLQHLRQPWLRLWRQPCTGGPCGAGRSTCSRQQRCPADRSSLRTAGR